MSIAETKPYGCSVKYTEQDKTVELLDALKLAMQDPWVPLPDLEVGDSDEPLYAADSSADVTSCWQLGSLIG